MTSAATKQPIADSAHVAPRRLFLQSKSVEETQAFFLRCGDPIRVAFRSEKQFDFEVMAVECDGVSLAIANSRLGMEIALESPPDCYSMLLPSSGALAFEKGKTDSVESRTDTGVVVDSSDVRVARFGPRCGWQRMAISSRQLHEHITLLTEQPVRERVKFKPHFDTQSGIARTMFAVSQAIIGGTRGAAPLLSAPTAMASLRDAVLAMFVEGLPHNYSDHLGHRVAVPAPRNVRHAIDFMHANIAKPLRLEDIARAAHASPRSLQLAFRNFRGSTPMEYLRRLRLDGARNDLIHCEPGTSVADVAYRWGFAHHGMFSANYAKAFGERPSATLRRGAQR